MSRRASASSVALSGLGRRSIRLLTLVESPVAPRAVLVRTAFAATGMRIAVCAIRAIQPRSNRHSAGVAAMLARRVLKRLVARGDEVQLFQNREHLRNTRLHDGTSIAINAVGVETGRLAGILLHLPQQSPLSRCKCRFLMSHAATTFPRSHASAARNCSGVMSSSAPAPAVSQTAVSRCRSRC